MIDLPPSITWADFHKAADAYGAAMLDTSVLVRMVARGEILIASDPVRARSGGEEAFRRGYLKILVELDTRFPRPSPWGDDD